MNKRKYLSFFLILCGGIVLATLFLWSSTNNAQAQCGSQASSCKNCHEVQAQDPVNNDGTGWHQSHAFGDFCYLCHAGNNQSMDKAEAHTGMVPPLSDVKAACQSCHPSDLMERAQVYATALGVEIGEGGSSGSAPTGGGATGGSDPAPASSSSSSTASQPPAPAMVVASDEVIDYAQRYNETVLGQTNVNWGNVILWLMILLVVVGGGAFIYWNERRLRGLPLVERKPALAKPIEAPVVEGYSSEVSAFLPLIADLNPVGRHALKRLLQNPEEASELLHSLSQLDPDLLRRIRSLDRESRHLLLALAGGD
jgi:hypothetical protein